jgi:hypothetical protein
MSVHIFAVVVALTMIAVVTVSLCVTAKLMSKNKTMK